MEENKNLPQNEDLNEILRVRREKLAALNEAGQNPFWEVRFDRTHLSSQILADFEALEGK